jgi:predicted nucleotidyltransferase
MAAFNGASRNHRFREKVKTKFDIKIKNTQDLIEKIQNNELPDKIMLNVHPQRWFDYGFHWYKELVGQNFKNVFKKLLIGLRN